MRVDEIVAMAGILVIDDEPEIRKLVHRVLVAAGHSVIEAADGKQGLQRLADSDPAVVITDIFMPDAEGIETIRKIRRSQPDMKILAMSGGSRSDHYLSAAREFGADAILQKPFRAAELLRIVTQLIGS